MICSVCAIGLNYVILKFLSVNPFVLEHELANSFLLFSVHKSFLQMIKKFSLRHRLHFLLILSIWFADRTVSTFEVSSVHAAQSDLKTGTCQLLSEQLTHLTLTSSRTYYFCIYIMLYVLFNLSFGTIYS